MAEGWILTLNAGSSSLRLAAFGPDATPRATRTLREIAVAGIPQSQLAAEIDDLGQDGPPALIGHRIVHGLDMTAPAELTPEVLALIDRASAFAPLHNPPALAMAALCARLYPAARHGGCFDTAFHAQNPDVATTIPLPKALRDQGMRRYGFHGLSYASVLRRFAAVTGQPLPRRVLMAHLGAGASLAAVVDGIGVATTMGFSPMDGLVMATRAGAMDPGVLFHLLRQGYSADAVEQMLNRESGLLAMAGSSSMKTLLDSNTPEAKAAVDHYCYWITRHAGAMIAAMGGIDGLVFTGGVGENAAPVRQYVADALGWTGLDPGNIWVTEADEEGEIASSMRALFGQAGFRSP
ncbi:acetate kinase [Rhodophyticola sp. CCM32]|uniref:acetate/propionate family kinase n=1 Tax=Rhodophyticola sp. CCM32 TaxID=2916397 RepID=UPI00107F0E5C|nr:acetate/propionate family kinase [Rhodophyticola sp. CCM32]QBX99912.1 acetate kinase [Rhodophyticola sp. CCM32]